MQGNGLATTIRDFHTVRHSHSIHPRSERVSRLDTVRHAFRSNIKSLEAMNVIREPQKYLFYSGVFLLCMCGLMLQILETRLLSVIALYYLAFFAISMAMFGMTMGALLIYFNTHRFRSDRLLEHLSWIASAFALAVVVSTLSTVSTVLGSSLASGLMVLLWFKLILIILPPYVLAGMAISLALTQSPWPVGLVYGVDLVGAAAGGLLVLALMSWLGGSSALCALGAIVAAAASCFRAAWRVSRGEVVRDSWVNRWFVLRHPALLSALLAALAGLNGWAEPHGIGPTIVKDHLSWTLAVSRYVRRHRT